MKDTDKITLTIGQLRRLIQESMETICDIPTKPQFTGDNTLAPYRNGVKRYKIIELNVPGSTYSGKIQFYLSHFVDDSPSYGDLYIQYRKPTDNESPLSGYFEETKSIICREISVEESETFVNSLFRKVKSKGKLSWNELIDFVFMNIDKFKEECKSTGKNTEEYPWWSTTGTDHLRD